MLDLERKSQRAEHRLWRTVYSDARFTSDQLAEVQNVFVNQARVGASFVETFGRKLAETKTAMKIRYARSNS